MKAERKQWRKDHPHGFYARPAKREDGSSNMLVWDCGIPGKVNTSWEGGRYTLTLKFTEDFPSAPPEVSFQPPIFHPNVYPSGRVCLSILDPSKGWKPSITLKQMLVGIQDLLDNPNNDDPAQSLASELLRKDPAQYKRRIERQARKYRAT
mmetsp:Transcript_10368/g.19360  ORF Transcript_10368/g.19360 Transcript_10368/m.19360 type:complete len:151 (+) Transcript_10368:288-740(+)